MTPQELQSLGLGKAKSEAVAAKVAKAKTDFRTLADRQKTITPDSKWEQFSGSRPGVVPAGTEDSTRDIEVYENVVAIVETGDKHTQVQIGTLIHVGNTWKTIDPPFISGEGQQEMAAMGFFFQAAQTARSGPAVVASDASQAILDEMERLEPGDPRRMEIIQKLVDQAKTPEERNQWVRQLADTLSAGIQTGNLPDGEKRLQSLLENAQKNADKNLAAYVKFRLLTAGYARAISDPKADLQKIQADRLKSLEQFVTDYPASPDAAVAMLELGIAREWAGQDDEAKKWYTRIGREFADSPQAKKAAGAARRIDSVGTLLNLSGKGPGGETVDLAAYRGKAVLIQFWATWSESAKNDMPALEAACGEIPRLVRRARRVRQLQCQDAEGLSGRKPLALAADLRGRRTGQPTGQCPGDHYRADHDPRRCPREGRESERPDCGDRGRVEETYSVIYGGGSAVG